MLYRLIVLVTSALVGWPQADIETHIAALNGTDKGQRIKAAKALEKLGRKAEPAIPALVACLNDDRPESVELRVGNYCGRALVAIGKPAVGPILEALKSRDHKLFAGAAQTVIMMEPPPEAALKTLFTALAERTGEKELARRRGWVAAKVLVKYGEKATPAVGGLLDMLQTNDFHEQVAACETLAAIGPNASAAVPRLVHLVREGSTSVRGLAAVALGNIGTVDRVDIVPVLERATRDFTVTVRGRAMMSLAMLGPKAKSALPTVHKYLRDKNYRNRHEAAYATWKIAGEIKEPLEVLVALSADIDTELDALAMLAKIGPAAKDVAPDLIALLDSKDPDKRFEIVQTLKSIAGRSDEVQKVLKKLAKSDPDADVRRIAKTGGTSK